jgi:flagellar hook protein FlgE
VGIGASIDKVSQQFTQGNISTTSNALDLAVNGQGFFRMSDAGTITYSRNGQFQTDKNGYIVNAAGLRLTGKLADSNGVLTGTSGDIKLNFSDAKPAATTSAGYNVNLDSRSATPSAMAKAACSERPRLPSRLRPHRRTPCPSWSMARLRRSRSVSPPVPMRT